MQSFFESVSEYITSLQLTPLQYAAIGAGALFLTLLALYGLWSLLSRPSRMWRLRRAESLLGARSSLDQRLASVEADNGEIEARLDEFASGKAANVDSAAVEELVRARCQFLASKAEVPQIDAALLAQVTAQVKDESLSSAQLLPLVDKVVAALASRVKNNPSSYTPYFAEMEQALLSGDEGALRKKIRDRFAPLYSDKMVEYLRTFIGNRGGSVDFQEYSRAILRSMLQEFKSDQPADSRAQIMQLIASAFFDYSKAELEVDEDGDIEHDFFNEQADAAIEANIEEFFKPLPEASKKRLQRKLEVALKCVVDTWCDNQSDDEYDEEDPSDLEEVVKKVFDSVVRPALEAAMNEHAEVSERAPIGAIS